MGEPNGQPFWVPVASAPYKTGILWMRCRSSLVRFRQTESTGDSNGRFRVCQSGRLTLSVRVNMNQPNNGQTLSLQDKRLLPKGDQRRYTAETVLRTRP